MGGTALALAANSSARFPGSWAGLPASVEEQILGPVGDMLTFRWYGVPGGCGSGNGSGSGGNPGTPADSYTVTVTAISGSLTHTASVTLTVN
jgi:hypothetical protein